MRRHSHGAQDKQKHTCSWRQGPRWPSIPGLLCGQQAPTSRGSPCSAPPPTPLHRPKGKGRRAAGRFQPHAPSQGLPSRLAWPSTHSGWQAIRPKAPWLFPHLHTSRVKKTGTCPVVSGPSLRMDPHCPLGPLPSQAVLSDRSLGDMCTGQMARADSFCTECDRLLSFKNEMRFRALSQPQPGLCPARPDRQSPQEGRGGAPPQTEPLGGRGKHPSPGQSP